MFVSSQNLSDRTFEHQILEAEGVIEEAIAKLSRLEEILDACCCEIQDSLGFDFVGISLISPEQNTIEAVYGTGGAEQWAGRSKHYLEEDPDLRDIQADIVKTRQTEIIAGWDDRFDRWIYEAHGHDRLIRIFTPIILVRDESGKTPDKWFEGCDWNILNTEKNENCQKTVFKSHIPDEYRTQVIGTVEAGYNDRNRSIEVEQALEFANLVSLRSLEIRRSRLPHVLEVIAENAKNIIGADLATLHIAYQPERERYAYEAVTGSLDPDFLDNYPPRQEGLGYMAIRDKRPKFIPDPDRGLKLESFNPPIFQTNQYRAIGAFPFEVDSRAFPFEVNSKDGVLYLGFKEERILTEGESRQIEHFIKRAVSAIRTVILYEKMRDRTRQLITLQSITQSLAHLADRGSLLRHLAWGALNILAADVVTIYECIDESDKEGEILSSPDIGGRLKVPDAMTSEIHPEDVTFHLIKSNANLYISSLDEDEAFEKSSFAEREKIKSVAGILLRIGQEKDIVGVMFINYRRSHSFSQDEKKMIETLASSAAVAIKEQRWSWGLYNIGCEINTTLNKEEALNPIIKLAVQMTGADVGDIFQPNPISRELVAIATYPDNIEGNSEFNCLEIEEGITGQSATQRQAILENDVNKNPNYKPFYPNTLSELCVPLLDRKGQVLGILNVESYKINAFTKRQEKRLKILANQAVSAIQNIETHKEFLGIEKIAILGDLAGPLVHGLNNSLGAIQVWAQRILDRSERSSKRAALEIQSLANKLLIETKDLQNWTNETAKKAKCLDLKLVLEEVIDRAELPNSIDLKPDLTSQNLHVEGDNNQLRNIFDTLIQNAKEAMPNGGTLSIHCSNREQHGQDWVIVQVTDTGIGIDLDDTSKIFSADYTTKPNHAGFGLWWARHYIKRLGGELEVESPVNGQKGTRFTVLLESCILD